VITWPAMTSTERRRSRRFNERRAEIIVPGALSAEKAMEMAQLKERVISDRALREGSASTGLLRLACRPIASA